MEKMKIIKVAKKKTILNIKSNKIQAFTQRNKVRGLDEYVYSNIRKNRLEFSNLNDHSSKKEDQDIES